ncbi:MAG: molybdopterin-binding protein [Ferrovum sp. 37-45-19]|jgi:DMSO/TMAO reductase YedYZ molybdopterin-dependent catalytic subunit|nr:MAG: molybdopterin-binding protein [Ferrovum sp. 21-44-67]OYV93162.1 MAG: molybdopterin-binding protein [Ferrovum sp. 37-45-19]OZB33090.1 MAG: molybdopterin-binding protein [Ferrovum sp. 34-44-207]HQT82422.1 molybdopterin-dependent oxidoreductase [Ferrovaceae bacterium]HQU07392.1 molybdopterin-dependent oxidoreductase [Ferrovaceae bacterium]
MVDKKKIMLPNHQDIIKDVYKGLDLPTRRLFGKNLLSLGAITLLTGCTLTNEDNIEQALEVMSRFNDRVQGWLFDPNKLAPTYSEEMITKPFPFNAYYDEDEIRPDPDNFKLKVSGLIKDKKDWSLVELNAMPQTTQITRHICVEGWSAIGKWGGVRFSDFLQRIGADTQARFVGFRCHDDYYTSIDMPTAMHPQTLLTLTFADQVLPAKYGYPLKLRIPTKLGYKNPKYIKEIFVTNVNPGGYWEDQGYNWFGGS